MAFYTTYDEWRTDFVRIVARISRVSEQDVVIDELASENCYVNGCTPFQAFTELWDIEPEPTGLYLSLSDGVKMRQLGPIRSIAELQSHAGRLVEFFTDSDTGHCTVEISDQAAMLLSVNIHRMASMERLMSLLASLQSGS